MPRRQPSKAQQPRTARGPAPMLSLAPERVSLRDAPSAPAPPLPALSTTHHTVPDVRVLRQCRQR